MLPSPPCLLMGKASTSCEWDSPPSAIYGLILRLGRLGLVSEKALHSCYYRLEYLEYHWFEMHDSKVAAKQVIAKLF